MVSRQNLNLISSTDKRSEEATVWASSAHDTRRNSLLNYRVITSSPPSSPFIPELLLSEATFSSYRFRLLLPYVSNLYFPQINYVF